MRIGATPEMASQTGSRWVSPSRRGRLLRRAAGDVTRCAGLVLLFHPYDTGAITDALTVLRTADPDALRRLTRRLLDDLMVRRRFDHDMDTFRTIADATYRIYEILDFIDEHPAEIAARMTL